MSSNEKTQSPKPEKPQKPIEVAAPPLVVATESYQPPIQKTNNPKDPK
ncbi:hypothetical protein [Pseudomonas sp. RIT288]|jgi:hypothetical protein|nr:hypothetical protein [Pseudomonas sp. RIT288]